jgi:hypothetical protein
MRETIPLRLGWRIRHGQAVRELLPYGYASSDERRLFETTIGPYWVSTIVCIGGRIWDESQPLFETMLWRGERSGLWEARPLTVEEATLAHEQACIKARNWIAEQ